MITSLSVVIIAQNDKKYKWEHSEAEKTMETRIEIDINAHSPTNDEMCKIITGKNISDFAHELQINPKYDYLFDKTA